MSFYDELTDGESHCMPSPRRKWKDAMQIRILERQQRKMTFEYMEQERSGRGSSRSLTMTISGVATFKNSSSNTGHMQIQEKSARFKSRRTRIAKALADMEDILNEIEAA